ncbi:hypothetical protein [Acanthopleuribacter pedis]|uniref:Uncharacterized protein n=1 Tax=Acanthopleuribacter pedis TaxID=442870 RepID=A0A8J7QIS2_9BACT|nr:hypothetical protein [Acanthopleuribacter pedis]MBO1321065.1 hypothetical protein [Acanthopleuribacter pedis]
MPIPLHETLHFCKNQIEAQLDWGESAGWKQRDYERLSGLILKETEISISLSTLRRLWKPEYAATPHPSTLEALAQFAGFESWHACQQQLHQRQEAAPPTAQSEPEPTPNPPPPPSSAMSAPSNQGPVSDASRFAPWIGSALLVGAVVLVLFSMFANHPAESFEAAPLPEVAFDHRTTVTRALPNTVIFDFDLAPLETKEATFQQSWNEAERVPLTPDQRHHAAVYYYPGFHRARLMVDGRIVADRRVHIQTEGWLPLARYKRRDTRPFYLPLEAFKANGIMGVQPETLDGVQLDRSRNRYWVSYYNVRDFGELTGNDFQLAARLRNRLEDGGLTCQQSELFVFCENGVYLIPMAFAGCVSNLSLWFPGESLSGRKHDFSAFGRDLSEWRELSLTAEAGRVTIHIDGDPVYQHQLALDAGPIKGLQFRFLGTGSVDWVELKSPHGETVYRDDF